MKLWIAQGFGIGRIPLAPGTFGSLVGILWFAVLLLPGSFWVLVGGSVAATALSVWLCGEAETLLGKRDPGSVVLDEIAAMPVCFIGLVAVEMWRTGAPPGLNVFFSAHGWPVTLAVFGAFRFFDVAKPWPVFQSQSLPGGWGVTLDDTLAAIYVNLTALLVYTLKSHF